MGDCFVKVEKKKAKNQPRWLQSGSNMASKTPQSLQNLPKWEPKWRQTRAGDIFFEKLKKWLNHNRVIELLKVAPLENLTFWGCGASEDKSKTRTTKSTPKVTL